jgi:hypothetical protein
MARPDPLSISPSAILRFGYPAIRRWVDQLSMRQLVNTRKLTRPTNCNKRKKETRPK